MVDKDLNFGGPSLLPGDKVRWHEIEAGVYVPQVAATLTNQGDTVELSTDAVSGSLQVVDYPHHELHSGNFFDCNQIDIALTDDSIISFRIATGATKNLHFAFRGSCGGNARLRFIERPTVTVNGAAAVINNQHRASAKVSTAVVTTGPTYTGGLVLVDTLLAGGARGQASGGNAGEDSEWILKRTEVYVVELQNISAGTVPASLSIDWYEESIQGG